MHLDQGTSQGSQGCDSAIFKKDLDRGHRDGSALTALVEDSIYNCL